MNFTELLLKHDLDEMEYKLRTEQLHGISISAFRRQCPIVDWICAAFLLDRSTDRLKWHKANQEWIKQHTL